jgi:dTMP kinase
MAHQGARLPQNRRNEFVDWIDELEYKVHKIPREDVVVYLYVPWQTGLELTKQKGLRAYIGTGQDIMEKDILHRQASEAMYLSLAKTRKNWIKIDCVENGALLPKKVIHEKLLAALKRKKII